jgi:CheY-like chemotaxis protein
MSRILIVSEDAAVAQQMQSNGHEADFEIDRTAWSQWDVTTLSDHLADLLLLDYRNPESVPGGITARLATELRQRDPQIPLVFIADFDPILQEMIQATIGERNVTFADTAAFANAGAIENLRTRLLALLHDAGKEHTAFQQGLNLSARAFPHLTPEVRNPNSGRLDARQVSDLFAIPLNRLATALGADSAAVYKTPDAPSLQPRLLLYERIARSLLRLVGSQEGLRIWLNTPEPDLDNEVPRDLILNGEGEVVVELLQDMQEGQPA